jgi:hypothetical protein
MHKSATKCNEIVGKWCKNKHGASKIIDTLETYQLTDPDPSRFGLTEPGGPDGPIGPNGSRPFVKTNCKFKFECYFLFELIQTQNSNNKDKTISYSLIK